MNPADTLTQVVNAARAADISFLDVAKLVLLVAGAIAISRYWKIAAEKDLAIGSVRSFLQLVAVGYVLEFVFEPDRLWLSVLVVMVMLTVGAYTAAGRVKGLPKVFPISLVAMTMGAAVTLAVMVLINRDWMQARYLIPLAGMTASNAMNAATLSMTRLVTDIKGNRLAIETSLSLGKTWRAASRPYFREAATAGMISILNFLKTVGIVALPGAMTGMILGGAEPLEAALLQVVVAYMLVSAVTITSVAATEMTVRRFFTAAHQLRYEP